MSLDIQYDDISDRLGAALTVGAFNFKVKEGALTIMGYSSRASCWTGLVNIEAYTTLPQEDPASLAVVRMQCVHVP
jgi:hypothetical protein